ncbi:MAG: C39 family peptidase [Gemmatimonadota bacterium]|nr:C39 family peptidase [Gemmatimonadota bacterium]MDH5805277.1 C39 family peptidase [Gemmatimonadota bacterium]
MGLVQDFLILPQPDDTTCGPTCLHSVYGFYGDHQSLEDIVAQVPSLETGGTLAVILACHALRRGYEATIFTYNLQLFDPSWFGAGQGALASNLEAQAKVKTDAKLRFATEQYLAFLELGGQLRFKELTPDLISETLKANRPILTGLSATYLYGCPREVFRDRSYYDDINGSPVGHFVVLYGYNEQTNQVLVADPLHDNPKFREAYYSIGIQRVIGAILLGILTYDANLLILEPKGGSIVR